MHYDPATKPFTFLEWETHCFATQFPSLDDKAINDQRIQILRRNAVYYISTESMRENQDPYIPYLAMNYFDRFIARNRVPTVANQGVEYCVRLLSICCLCVAWKMRISSFQYRHFLHNRDHLKINREDILHMELAILNGLDWQMRSVTALSFVKYLSATLQIPTLLCQPNIAEIIIQAQGDIKFSQFRPSIIAGSSILVSWPWPSHDKAENFKAAFNERDQPKIDSCCKMMIEMCQKKDIPLEILQTECNSEAESSRAQAEREAALSRSDSFERRPGKKPMFSEVGENIIPKVNNKVMKLNFKLKWLFDNKNIDLKIDPSLIQQAEEEVSPKSAKLSERLKKSISCFCFKS